MATGWWQSNKTHHINTLKLKAVHNTLVALLPHLHGKAIAIQCDNITTVAHLNHMGGKSQAMNHVCREIYYLCEWEQIQLSTSYLPSINNTKANWLSHLHPHHKWSLACPIFETID
jgi:hypothetical protein